MQTLFTAPGRSGHGRSSRFRAPARGAAVRNNWVSINQLAAGLLGQSAALQSVRGQFEALKLIARYLDSLHPFKIYQLPAVLRAAPDPASDWRKVLVRAGRVLETDATGTDAVNSDPDSETYPATPSETTVSADTDDFYFWLEVDTSASPTTATVRSGTLAEAIDGSSGGSAWPAAPVPDTDHIPIGVVDTQTAASDKRPIIRQLLRADIIFFGSSSPCPLA